VENTQCFPRDPYSARPWWAFWWARCFSACLRTRIGRRPVLIGASIYFSALTFFTARTNSVNELIAVRFLAGIGLGGIIPNAVAMVGEYSPARLRVTVMMVVSNGFTAGAAIGGFVAAALIPAYGWRGVFYFGAAIPLAIRPDHVFPSA